jgi:amino acid transporter
MTASGHAGLSRGALVALVIGSMVGAGIFTLPAAFGRTTGAPGAVIAWCIAGTGMLMLALVFQELSRRRPDLDAGIYAYAKAGFGNYLGFTAAFGSWIVCCLEAYGFKLAWTGEAYEGNARARAAARVIGALAAIHARREQRQPVFTPGERPVFVLFCTAAVVALIAPWAGAITI